MALYRQSTGHCVCLVLPKYMLGTPHGPVRAGGALIRVHSVKNVSKWSKMMSKLPHHTPPHTMCTPTPPPPTTLQGHSPTPSYTSTVILPHHTTSYTITPHTITPHTITPHTITPHTTNLPMFQNDVEVVVPLRPPPAPPTPPPRPRCCGKERAHG